MVAAVPELEINNVIGDIASLMDRSDASEFEIQRIRRRVSLLWQRKALAPYEYHMTIAMLEVVAGNRLLAESAAKNALLLAPNSEAVALNCMGVYSRFLNVDAVIQLIHHMYESFPDNKKILRCAIMNAHDVLQFSFAREMLLRLDKLSVNDPTEDSIRKYHLLSTLDLAKSIAISDEDLASRLKVAVNAVRAFGEEIRQVSSLTLDDGAIMLHLHIEANYQHCALANFAIADALVENFDDTGVNLVSIVCLPFSAVLEFIPKGVDVS